MEKNGIELSADESNRWAEAGTEWLTERIVDVDNAIDACRAYLRSNGQNKSESTILYGTCNFLTTIIDGDEVPIAALFAFFCKVL